LARAKKQTPETVEVKQTDGVIFMKASRPLTVQEHEELSKKLRYEEENTGLKIILVPFTLEPVDGE
jgi:hypothetical protein